MERRGKLEDLDRSFDIQFWQAQLPIARFQATWELILHAARVKGLDVRQLRLQRSVESFQRQQRLGISSLGDMRSFNMLNRALRKTSIYCSTHYRHSLSHATLPTHSSALVCVSMLSSAAIRDASVQSRCWASTIPPWAGCV